MSITEISNHKTETILWRTRWDNEYTQLDLALAKLLQSVGVGIEFVKVEGKPAVEIKVENYPLYEVLNNITQKPEYIALNSAFSGENLRMIYQNDSSWDTNTRAQVEAFYWRRHAENLEAQLTNINNKFSIEERRKIEVVRLGSNAMIDKILRPLGVSELSVSQIQTMLLKMFDEEYQKNFLTKITSE